MKARETVLFILHNTKGNAMTVTVHFEEPQMRVENGEAGIEISQIVMPYSIRNTEDLSQYLGGQVVLTKEDGIAFTDNTEDWDVVALTKIKDMVAVSEVYAPEEPIENEGEAVPAEPIADDDGAIAEEPIVNEKAVASEELTLNEEEVTQDEQ